MLILIVTNEAPASESLPGGAGRWPDDVFRRVASIMAPLGHWDVAAGNCARRLTAAAARRTRSLVQKTPATAAERIACIG